MNLAVSRREEEGIDINLFEFDRVECSMSYVVTSKSGSTLTIDYKGVGEDIEKVADEAEAAMETLVGFFTMR